MILIERTHSQLIEFDLMVVSHGVLHVYPCILSNMMLGKFV
jgi:hypothetical protein